MSQLYLLIGPTGSGKSVQAEALVAKRPTWVHISSGELLRADPVAAEAIAAGELVSSAEIERILGQALELSAAAPIILLDGFPRILDQVTWLDQYTEQHDCSIGGAIVFKIDRATVEMRLAERHRDDDVAAVVAAKWQVYEQDVVPVISAYEQRGIAHTVDGARSIDDLAAELEGVIHV